MKKIISGIFVITLITFATLYAKNNSEAKTSKASCPNTPDCICTK